MLSKPDVESSDGRYFAASMLEVQQVPDDVRVLGAVQPVQARRAACTGLRLRSSSASNDAIMAWKPGDPGASCRRRHHARAQLADHQFPRSASCATLAGSSASIASLRAESMPAAFAFSLWHAMQVLVQERLLCVLADCGTAGAAGVALARRAVGVAGCAGWAGGADCGRVCEGVVGACSGRLDWAWTAKATKSAAMQPTTSDSGSVAP